MSKSLSCLLFVSYSNNAAFLDRCIENLAMLLTQSDSQGRHRVESQSGQTFTPRSCVRLSHPSYIRVKCDFQLGTETRAPGTSSPWKRRLTAARYVSASTKNFPGTSDQQRSTLWNHPRRENKKYIRLVRVHQFCDRIIHLVNRYRRHNVYFKFSVAHFEHLPDQISAELYRLRTAS